ncbi:hypothetical protein FHU33_1907 [Blastococcus colisei]|uniref:Uncharacterized protein n=1 Tax=Blastococcus colisei TaxID=1564162 RepID=A0A543PEJ1_9ACTN|nr:hypothetical protein [Blastococcus colisei]TQN42505.1 hypothetical protein FHU33_1907 [Blastococcus colisei]
MTRSADSVPLSDPPRPDADGRRSLHSRRHRSAAIALGLGALTMGVAETIHPRGGPDGPACCTRSPPSPARGRRGRCC